jgi:acetyl esterase/lipase
MNHGFMQMGSELPEARQAFRDAAVFLSAALNRSIRPMETTR